jgi:hypothetical protein
MSLMHKALDAITETDVRGLVDNQVREGRTLEYKLSLPGNSDGDKKEFLYDVSSFANAGGGNIIYGIREADGAAAELVGLSVSNIDAELLRLGEILRNGVDPRIPGVQLGAVPLGPKGVAIIIRLPQSFALPHVVKYGGTFKFYSRTSAGKYQLDVAELRSLFALFEATAERVRNFRLERLGTIVANQAPALMEEGPKLVLHLVSFRAFEPGARYDLAEITHDPVDTKPMACGGWDNWFNLDGYLAHAGREGGSPSYTQIFRQGIVEACTVAFLGSRTGERGIRITALEQEVAKNLSRYTRTLKKMGVEPPLFVMLSILGVKGYTIGGTGQFWAFDGRPIDRDDLIIPEIMMEAFEADPYQVMRPAFDAVWNAAGWARDMHYDSQGNWRAPV